MKALQPMVLRLCVTTAASLVLTPVAIAQPGEPAADATAQAEVDSGPEPAADDSSEAASSERTGAAAAVDDSFAVEEIVVTAQKREQSLREVPMSITAVSGDELSEKGISDVEGLVKVTPGLSYVESGSGVPVYSLRGVGFFDTSLGARPTVGVYTDEVQLPFSIMSQGAALDLQRVEILKGPQGTLFGQNATGGAINYIAAKPTQDFEAGVSTSLGRFYTSDTTGYVSGALAPTLNARLAGRVASSDDWQKSDTRDDSLGQKRFYQGRFLLDWTPSDRLFFELNANGFHDGSDTQAAQLVGRIYSSPAYSSEVPIVVNQPVAPSNNRAADWDPERQLRRDNDFYQYALRGELQASDAVTITSLTAYSHMRVEQLVDQDGTAATASLTNVAGVLSSFSQELRAAANVGRATVVVGANYSHDKSEEESLFQFPYTTSSYSTIPGMRTTASQLRGRQRFNTKAVFGNVDFAFTDELLAHAGLRYTDVDLHYVSCSAAGDATSAATYGTLVNVLRGRAGLPAVSVGVGSCISLDSTLTPGEIDAELKEDNVSWRAGLDWKPAADTLFYANVSKGYKSGSAPTLPAIEQSELAPVTQESVLAYEAGLKLGLLNRRIDLTAAIFDYEYQDKQLQGRRPTVLGVLPGLVNVPDSRIRGVEFQVDTYLQRTMRLTLAGTYLDSEVSKDFDNYSILGDAANFKGNDFPYTPKYQLVADWSYERGLSEQLDGVVGVNANYRSSTNAGFGDDERLAIDAYTLVDLRAGVKSSDEQWSAIAFVRNLTDEYYWTNVARQSDVIRRYAGQPRMYGLQLSFKF
ncbi:MULTISPECIES: TonB-dependent receptor [Hydrocarboniphaga]|uniref:TonB-dependent receptor n=1 Tax=Hydrocarboniphaga effusa AP103 TaxID=1172194 RepID=I8T1V8_9GAMM|nr:MULTISPECIES: TonB-dependent receptor [Hydrocarboniphaga]EIT67900.1 TonB-dependent receptor [Hydrocarboniphaga effusa AP103]MDZ4079941.1 TonB-dependent receptor [Hydrocarboniphaga sp.]